MTVDQSLSSPEAQSRVTGSRVRAALTVLIVAALLAGAVAVGFRWGQNGDGADASAVDIGFAQDMSTHHSQAVTMAAYARDYTDDSQIKLLAYDIEEQQAFQIGQMHGWLDAWGASRNDSTPMSWMNGHDHLSADGLMPGMATPAELDRLKTLHGKSLDIDFLQLMIRHHQGGVPMAQYAADHASSGYVRDLAQSVVTAQSSEIVSMEQLLRQLGGAPLPPPEH